MKQSGKVPKTNIRFSIVVPAFNEAHYIADTIDSLKRQHYQGSYEIIVVDNNSTDQTATISKSLGARVVDEPHPGVCWARQRGTAEAKGEIVISTDADTIFARDWLQRIEDSFNANPKAVAIAGPCRFIGGPLWGVIYPYFLFGFVSVTYKFTRRTIYVSATNLAFKKAAWTGYDTSLTQGGDEVDMIRKLRKHGRVIFVNDNPTFTSARRLARGLVYNVLVSFLIYYLLEYNLNRIFKRSIIGTAPKFRNELSPRTLPLIQFALAFGLLFLFFVYTHPGHMIIRYADRATHRAVNEVQGL
ncbi:MAG TPA: glycosyltransferase family 2 protein [Patescibacteria group bacterium]|nr:glycosyltransferase family 2 protein [Patescibacteria group bacterium]